MKLPTLTPRPYHNCDLICKSAGADLRNAKVCLPYEVPGVLPTHGDYGPHRRWRRGWEKRTPLLMSSCAAEGRMGTESADTPAHLPESLQRPALGIAGGSRLVKKIHENSWKLDGQWWRTSTDTHPHAHARMKWISKDKFQQKMRVHKYVNKYTNQ